MLKNQKSYNMVYTTKENGLGNKLPITTQVKTEDQPRTRDYTHVKREVHSDSV